MHVTRKGQVTIPQKVRESMGIIPAETEVDFLQDEQGQWYPFNLVDPRSRWFEWSVSALEQLDRQYTFITTVSGAMLIKD